MDNLKNVAILETRGGAAKRKTFRCFISGDQLIIDKLKSTGPDKVLEYPIAKLIDVIHQIHREFQYNWFPLANNVEKLHNETEKAGLGRILYSAFSNIYLAQGASYLGPVFEHVGIFQWNGKSRGIAWRLKIAPELAKDRVLTLPRATHSARPHDVPKASQQEKGGYFMNGMTLGEFIRQQREKKFMNQKELAEKAGISQGLLSHIETGRKNHAKPLTLRKIANALGIDVAELFKHVRRINSSASYNSQSSQDTTKPVVTLDVRSFEAILDALGDDYFIEKVEAPKRTRIQPSSSQDKFILVQDKTASENDAPVVFQKADSGELVICRVDDYQNDPKLKYELSNADYLGVYVATFYVNSPK